jgi:elongation factor Ts
MNLDDIKRLREMTSMGVNDCKKAIDEAMGDFDKAFKLLKDRGAKIVEAKKDRRTSQGLIEAYIHFSGNLGAIVEVNCETDFVARTDNFKKFVKDLAVHVAAAGPKYLAKENVPAEALKTEASAEDYLKTNCLLEQPFVKDASLTIKDYLSNITSQTGENVVIKRFVRFALGDN